MMRSGRLFFWNRGRRGRMYPIGSNAINDRTIGESAQGLADYVIASKISAVSDGSDGGKTNALSCAIAYDHSPSFASLCRALCIHHGCQRIHRLFLG